MIEYTLTVILLVNCHVFKWEQVFANYAHYNLTYCYDSRERIRDAWQPTQIILLECK